MRPRKGLPHHKSGGRHIAGRHHHMLVSMLALSLVCGLYFTYPRSLAATRSSSDAPARRLAEANTIDERSVFRSSIGDGSLYATRGFSSGNAEDGITSKMTVQVSPSGSGLMNKYYFRFRDVLVRKDKIVVYYGPDFQPPTREHWIDFISGNTTSPDPPTMMVIKGDLHSSKWYYLPIEYVPASEQQPVCKDWIEKPAFLLQVRYSYNIWHTWNEGLMGLFQTLREHGQLPMVNIDDEGNIDEIEQGMGDGCPWEYDVLQGKAIQPTDCGQRTGLVSRDKCDPATESWCRPGVMSWLRSGSGPVIIPYTAASVMNVWAHLYRAMTNDIRDWSVVDGACFRDLTIGKTSTLNFYQAITGGGKEAAEASIDKRLSFVDNKAARVEAMAVFKAFVHSAQKEWITTEHARNPTFKRWEGYKDPGMDRLRRGVGPEALEALDYVVPKDVPGMLREELDELHRVAEEREEAMEVGVDAFVEVYGGAQKTLDKEVLGDAYVADEDDDVDERGQLIMREKKPQAQAEHDQEAQAALAASGQLPESSEWMTAPRKVSAEWGLKARQEAITAAKKRRAEPKSPHAAITKHPQVQQGEGDFPVVDTTNEGSYDGPQDTRHRRQRQLLGNKASSKHETKPFFRKAFKYQHEKPRPVVVYGSRNFFSRGVLNEADILEYILLKYNVTLKVTTFEEPLLEVMETLGNADVFFGMHGAGWTNGLFMKRGASTLQMFPYGWRLPSGATLRGFNYREIVLASECPYTEWVNPHPEHAFFRRIDFSKKADATYTVHPQPTDPLPADGFPGNQWIYQNTYVDMKVFGPVIDDLMKMAGIPLMEMNSL